VSLLRPEGGWCGAACERGSLVDEVFLATEGQDGLGVVVVYRLRA